MGEAQAGGCYEDRWASEEAAARFKARWVEVEDRRRQGVRDRWGARKVRAGLAARFRWSRGAGRANDAWWDKGLGMDGDDVGREVGLGH
jgi:hypothetical protein